MCGTNYAADAISGSFTQIQERQGCTCLLWNEISANKSMLSELPHQSHHALLTIGKMNFEDSIIMTYPAMMEGLLATVPVQITYGMLLGKVGQKLTQLHDMP